MVGAEGGTGLPLGTARCPPSQREAGLNLPGGRVRLSTRTGSSQRRCLPATFLADLCAVEALAALLALATFLTEACLASAFSSRAACASLAALVLAFFACLAFFAWLA